MFTFTKSTNTALALLEKSSSSASYFQRSTKLSGKPLMNTLWRSGKSVRLVFQRLGVPTPAQEFFLQNLMGPRPFVKVNIALALLEKSFLSKIQNLTSEKTGKKILLLSCKKLVKTQLLGVVVFPSNF